MPLTIPSMPGWRAPGGPDGSQRLHLHPYQSDYPGRLHRLGRGRGHHRHATAAVIGWVESDDANTADTSMVSLGPGGMNLGELTPLGNAFAA
ncbi:hypothetical protein, partial [Porticoccus sp.]